MSSCSRNSETSNKETFSTAKGKMGIENEIKLDCNRIASNISDEDMTLIYDRLDSFDKSIYDIICEVLAHSEDTNNVVYVAVPKEHIQDFKDDYLQCCYAVLEDNPEYDLLSAANIKPEWEFVSDIPENGIYHIKLYSSASYPNYTQEMIELNEACDKFIADIDTTGNQYDTALKIHDKLIKEVSIAPDDSNSYYSKTMYGALINGSSNCAGYANAYCFLLRKCGIDCLRVSGYLKDDSPESGTHSSEHTWNIAKLDGRWSETDVIFDDIEIAYYVRKSELSEPSLRELENKTDYIDAIRHVYWDMTTAEMTEKIYGDEFDFVSSTGEKYSFSNRYTAIRHIRDKDAEENLEKYVDYMTISKLLPEANIKKQSS